MRERTRPPKKKVKLKPRFYILLAGVLVAIYGSYYFVFQSSVFLVREIHVEGNDHVPVSMVIEYSQVRKGDQLFRVKPVDVAKRVTLHPYIREATVNRQGMKGVNIVVREREEYAIIPYMGLYVLLDREQYVLDVSDGLFGNHLCIVTGIEFLDFTIGQQAQVHHPQYMETVYNTLDAAREAEILDMISEINIDSSGNVRIVMFNGIEALLGKEPDPAYMVLALKEALITLHIRGMNNVILDMRYGGQIIVQERMQWEEEDEQP